MVLAFNLKMFRLSFTRIICRQSVVVKTSNTFVLYLNRFLATKMSNWETEKQKFMSMTPENKKQFYSAKNIYKVQDIPTWVQYAKTQDSLPEKIPMLPENKINSAKNSVVANKISVFKGDITTLEIDAIVNAANKSLLGGGGVDGAIHRAAGPNLKAECQTLGGCQTGDSKLTGGYKLPAKYVIHTVGPQGEQPDFLRNCYKSSLEIMKAEGLKTIAFPCVSTGVYGYPLVAAAHVAMMQVRAFLEENVDDVERVIFCLFSPEDEDVYQKVLQSYFPLSE